MSNCEFCRTHFNFVGINIATHEERGSVSSSDWLILSWNISNRSSPPGSPGAGSSLKCVAFRLAAQPIKRHFHYIFLTGQPNQVIYICVPDYVKPGS